MGHRRLRAWQRRHDRGRRRAHHGEAKFGDAITFDGDNYLITVPDANSLDLTNGMTLEAWVRPTASGNYRTVLLKETTGDLVYALYALRRSGLRVQRPSAWTSRTAWAHGCAPGEHVEPHGHDV